ncbi:hypothetical protein AC1031_000942 [Aphanomyces cochlioides]|nr:hypothetical protein AC1031_000942 [Aphanomyces cochlioides]
MEINALQTRRNNFRGTKTNPVDSDVWCFICRKRGSHVAQDHPDFDPNHRAMAKRQSLSAKRIKSSDSSDSCASDSEATRSFSVNAISSKNAMELEENDFDGMPTLEQHWTLGNCATGHVSGNKALFDAWHGTAELILPNKTTIIG